MFKCIVRPHIILLFILFLIIRLSCLFCRESFFVADEYWQSLEVAHYLTFGYGYLTWEWIYAIRSYIYVGWIAALYKILEIFQWDTVRNLTLLPCIVQAIFTALSDIFFTLWTFKVSVCGRQAYWSVYYYISNVFVAYCASRTLTNTLELNLTCLALYYYPWFHKSGSRKYFWFVCIACVVRPTAAILWLPLCIFDIKNQSFKVILNKYILIGLEVLALSTAIDTYFYGKLVFTWWNFVLYNLFHNISTHYSVQSYYWYFIIGLPVVLGPAIVPFYRLVATYLSESTPSDHVFRKLFYTTVWALVIYSFMPHKEFRFILPLCPLMVQIASYQIYEWSIKLRQFYAFGVLILVLLANIHVFYYLSVFHQVGTIKVMNYLNHPNNNLLFLIPCHLAPLYSHLHVNITTRFLHCDPPLNQDPNYIEEQDLFYRNPEKWLNEEYPLNKNVNYPTHIVCFNSLESAISKFLKSRNYTMSIKLYHADFVPPRVSNYVLLFNRTTYI